MRILRTALVGLALMGLAGVAHAQTAPAAPAAPAVDPSFVPPTILQNVTEGVTATLTVTSDGVAEGGAIPDKYSAWYDNVSLPVSWTPGPEGTQAYAVAVEDVIMGRPNTVQHWIIYNIPATVTSLPEALPQGNPVADAAPGALQAKSGDIVGYRGPRPPGGTTHDYFVQVFALDAPLTVAEADAKVATITEALKGHVLAAGQLAAKFTNTMPPAPPAAAPAAPAAPAPATP